MPSRVSAPLGKAQLHHRVQVRAKKQVEALESHLRGYLARWGKKGGAARQVVAHFKLGELLWKRSCPREQTNGSCVEIERPYKSPLPAMAFMRILSRSGIHKFMHTTRRIKERCRPYGNLLWKAIPREPRLAREAQEHFKTALLLSDRPEQAGPSSPELTADFAFARAGAAFYRAEAIYERLLDTSFPPDLDFQNGTQFDKPKVAMARAKKREDSLRKLTDHMSEKNRLLEQMVGPEPKGLYERVSEYGVPHWRLAALARMAQAHANLANQLFLPPIPKGLKEQDEWGNRPREIFCDELASFAEPFEAKAVRGYQLCLETASKQPWWNEWSALCEEELHRIDPVRYPLSSEMGPEADFASPFSVPPAVQHDCVPREPGTR